MKEIKIKSILKENPKKEKLKKMKADLDKCKTVADLKEFIVRLLK